MSWTYFFLGILAGGGFTSLIIMTGHLASISRALRDLNDRDSARFGRESVHGGR